MRKQPGTQVTALVFDKTISEATLHKLSARTSPISKDEAIHIANTFANRIREDVDNNAQIYLFGSTAQDTANLDSDIDVAVISETNNADCIKSAAKYAAIARTIDFALEIHTITTNDWQTGNPHVLEVKTRGLQV